MKDRQLNLERIRIMKWLLGRMSLEWGSAYREYDKFYGWLVKMEKELSEEGKGS